VPLEAGAPQSFDASYGPDYWHYTYTGTDRSALKYTWTEKHCNTDARV
jgi:hypothetical protein